MEDNVPQIIDLLDPDELECLECVVPDVVDGDGYHVAEPERRDDDF